MTNTFETSNTQTIRRRPTELELSGRLSLEKLNEMCDTYPEVDVEILPNRTVLITDPLTRKLGQALAQIEGLAS